MVGLFVVLPLIYADLYSDYYFLATKKYSDKNNLWEIINKAYIIMLM